MRRRDPGREVEQAIVSDLLGRTRSGKGGFIAISGEPGIGKTTLLEWAADAAESLVILRAAGRESEVDLPFVAIADLLRPLEGLTIDLPPGQAYALLAVFSLSTSGTQDRGSVNAASITLLGRATRQTPAILLIDDYHWLDSASRDVIDFLSRRSRVGGFGMVLTTRGPLPDDHDGSVVDLHPLSTEAATDLLALRGVESPEMIRQIVTLAAGNPLALMELPVDFPSAAPPASSWASLTVSASIERAYRRVAGHTPVTITALVALSIETTGLSAKVQELLALLGLDRDSLAPALADGLVLNRGGTIRFRHPLLRSVVQQMTSPAELRRIHLAAAAATQDEDEKAWHRAAATDGADDEVALALEGAARRALARGAATTAANGFERSAEMSTARSKRSGG